MAYAPRPTNTFTNQTNASSSTSHTTSSHLQNRIAQKRAELAHLQSLRDSSATLASQLSVLETKLSTLKDGAQSVALVLANWDNVLRAIAMAAAHVPQPSTSSGGDAAENGEDEDEDGDGDGDHEHDEVISDARHGVAKKTKSKGNKGKTASKSPELPVPLVRIPVQPRGDDGG